MLPFTDTGSSAKSGTPTLIFLHFFGSSQREWHHVIDLLAPGFRCIAADLPGFGQAKGIEGYTVQRMAEQVTELVEHIAPSPVVLVGHSMGGKVSMVVAHTPPTNLTGLVLVAPSPLTPEPMEGNTRVIMAKGNEDRTKADVFVRGGAHRPLSAEDYEIAMLDVERANDAAWKAWPQSGSREDWSMDIQEIALPSLLIVGECDKSIPLEYQRGHTLPKLRDGSLHVIENAGHLLPYEVAGTLASRIREFLESGVTSI